MQADTLWNRPMLSTQPTNIEATVDTGAILDMQGVSKRYGGALALDSVRFDLLRGEVHALVGENGAGKSTLCKIVAGAITPDAGTVRLAGREMRFRTPIDALREGITMVYQETSLVPTMSVAQNIELGREKLLTKFSTLNIHAQTHLQSMNFQVDPTALVSTLGTAKRQMVEIARALRGDVRLIIFDEPTAALSPEEIWYLFNVIRDLKRRGIGVIFVSHALEEALTIADRVTVLRDGKLQITAAARELTKEAIVRQMVGRDLALAKAELGVSQDLRQDMPDLYRARHRKVLRVEGLTMGTVVKSMSFSAYSGEVLGIFGLIGAGRTEAAKVVAGIAKRNRIQGGLVLLNDRPIRYRVPTQAIRNGIVYVTEDRKLNGFFETMRVADNVYIGWLASARRKFMLSTRQRERLGNSWRDRLHIVTMGRRSKLAELSGGNQQKVTLAKSLVQDPSVIIFDEPTRGVDVGAIADIHAEIRRLAAAGKAVIVISSYLPEVRAISDRILVARLGRVVAEFSPTEATEEAVMYAAVY